MKEVAEASKVSLIEIGASYVPAVSLGTSPFIGAGQFGRKAPTFQEKFLKHPANIVRLIVKAVRMGIPSVQVLPLREIIWSIKEAQKESGTKIATIFTVGLEDIDAELDSALEFGSSVVFIHGAISDRRSRRQIEEISERIRLRGLIPGAVTHQPDRTIPFIEKGGFDIEAYLAPINPLGYLMGQDPEKTIELIKATDKIVIAKKVLAAGRISPEEGFSYVKKIESVKGITVGITSEEEMDHTFKLALRLWPG